MGTGAQANPDGAPLDNQFRLCLDIFMSHFDPAKLFLFGRDTMLPNPFPTDRHPKTLALNEARYLKPEDEIMVLERGGSTRGYPIRVVAPHHIVEDVVDSQPVVVTF